MEMVMFSELHRDWVMHMPQLFHFRGKSTKDEKLKKKIPLKSSK